MTNEELCRKIAGGETRYENELWEQTYRLFHYHATQMYNRNLSRAAAFGVQLDDCKQVCWFAFTAALRDYNKKPQTLKFTAFIRLHVQKQVYKLIGLQHCRQEPLNYALSLDAPADTDDGSVVPLGDNIVDGAAEEPFADIETADAYKTVSASVENLSDRHKAVIRAKYYDGKTTAEIAEQLGEKQEHIRRWHKDALRKLSRDTEIQKIREQFFANVNLYKHTGFTSFRETGLPSVERAVLRLEELLERAKGGNYYDEN